MNTLRNCYEHPKFLQIRMHFDFQIAPHKTKWTKSRDIFKCRIFNSAFCCTFGHGVKCTIKMQNCFHSEAMKRISKAVKLPIKWCHWIISFHYGAPVIYADPKCIYCKSRCMWQRRQKRNNMHQISYFFGLFVWCCCSGDAFHLKR